MTIEQFCKEYPKTPAIDKEIKVFKELVKEVPSWGLYHLIDYQQGFHKLDSDVWWFYEEMYNCLDVCKHTGEKGNFCSNCGKLLNLSEYLERRNNV